MVTQGLGVFYARCDGYQKESGLFALRGHAGVGSRRKVGVKQRVFWPSRIIVYVFSVRLKVGVEKEVVVQEFFIELFVESDVKEQR